MENNSEMSPRGLDENNTLDILKKYAKIKSVEGGQ